MFILGTDWGGDTAPNPYGQVGRWTGEWVGGYFQEIFPLCGSILQAGTGISAQRKIGPSTGSSVVK